MIPSIAMFIAAFIVGFAISLTLWCSLVASTRKEDDSHPDW